MKFIGLDIGTTSICGIVLDKSSSQILSVYTEPNNSNLQSKNDWEKIQDPEITKNIALNILSGILTEYPDIKGIGLTGQMHGILYVDNKGNAVSPLYTWQDGRGNIIFENNKTYAEYLSEIIGHKLATGYGLATHFHNLKNNLVPETAAHICTIADYISMQLSGNKSPLVDTTNAASLGCFNLQTLKFDSSAIKKAGINISLLPEIVPLNIPIGKYKGRIPVFPAIGDNQASVLGSVKEIKKSVSVSIGTSSQISFYSEELFDINKLDIRPFPFKGYLYVGAALCGGKSYELLRDFFSKTLKLFNQNPDIDMYDVMNSVDIDSFKNDFLLKVDPKFQGTRENPNHRAKIENITSDNFTPDNLIASFMYGMVYELFEFYKEFPQPIINNIKNIIGSGNAIHNNKLLQKILSKTFKKELIIASHKEEAARGAALICLYRDIYI